MVDIEDMVTSDKRITCNYHCWSYDLSGKLKSTPLCNNIPKEQYGLFQLDIRIVNHVIYVRTKSHGKPITIDRTFVQYPLTPLDIVYTDTYQVNCNWKFLMQNFCCWYHVPFIHPSLTKVSGVNEHAVVSFTDSSVHFKTDPISFDPSSPIDPKQIISTYMRPDEAHFIVLFPCTFLFIFPDHVFQVFVTPVNDSESIERVYLLATKEMQQYANYETLKNQLVKFYVDTNNEDIGICESLQKGVKTNLYKGGPYVLPYESATQHFDNIYKNHMSLSNI